jgi:hypothetical protein
VEPDANAIENAPVSELTSGDLEDLKELIKHAIAEREAISNLIHETRAELRTAKARLRRAENWFFGLFLSSKVPERRAAVKAKSAELTAQEEKRDQAFIDADFSLDGPTRAAFEEVTRAFEAVARCAKIWDITSECATNRKQTRSAATLSVERTPVDFSISDDPVLQTDGSVPRLENANGADLLMYPGFVLVQNTDDLALIDLREITITYASTRFVETDPPADADVVDHAWAKCNKDGSPDRRFADNYQIPIALYGEVTLKSDSGLYKEYQFSSAKSAERFADSLADFQTKLRVLGERGASEPRSRVPVAARAFPQSPPPISTLKSIRFLQSAVAASVERAFKVLERFGELLKAEVDASSGSRSLAELEALVSELARVPDEVRSFVKRSPAAKPGLPKILKAVRSLVGDYLRQIRTSIEQVEQKSEQLRRLLKHVCEAEELLQH